MKENELLLVIYFYQDYKCKYSEEIHSAHFGALKKQVSMHTREFHYLNKELGQVDCISFCGVPECLRHDYFAVWAYLQPVLNSVNETIPELEMIHFQSNGPTTQYKKNTIHFYFNISAKHSGLPLRLGII